MPWSDYEVKQRKRENSNVNVIKKNGAEKIVADQFNFAKIWWYGGCCVWWHWWKLENTCRMKIVQTDNSNSNCKKSEVSLKKQETSREHLMEDHKYKYV